MMQNVIIAVWVVGLFGALVATLIILKLSQLVIRTLIDIGKLGRVVENAAQGVAANVGIVATLPDLGPPGETLTAAAQRTRRALESVAARIARPSG